MNNILNRSRGNAKWLTEVRRTLHSTPETGFDTKNTAAFVTTELEKMGIEAKGCGRAGITATVGSGGPVFLLRADMDALPIREEAELPFAATNGNMHACGHDMHTAMLLGAAKLLKDREQDLQGTVKLMFQSAEELFEGAKDMIDNGILENPRADAGMMVHVMSGMPVPTGTVIVCDGGVSAPGADFFTVKIQGKGCHGSMPNTGIDPITVGAHVILALQELHSRELSLADRAVLTVGSIHAGQAPNIIPDTLELSGSMRTFDEEMRGYLKERIESIAAAIAQAYRATAQITWGPGCPALQNDEALSRDTFRWTQELLGPGKALSPSSFGSRKGTKLTGSEDFAYISQKIPTIMVSLAAGNPADGHNFPLHHPKVTFDEEALPVGAAVLANTALRWLENHK